MLDLIAMAKARDADGPITALDTLIDALFAEAVYGDPRIKARVGDAVYVPEIDGGQYTGHWKDAKGRMHSDEYVAACAIHAARPNLANAEITADSVRLIKAGGRRSDVEELAHALIFYRGR